MASRGSHAAYRAAYAVRWTKGVRAGREAARENRGVMELRGKISDRIRSGEIDADPLATLPPADDRPSADAVRHGSGHALGEPARSDRGASTHER